MRQHCLQYLINEKQIPQSLINVEKQIRLNGINKRYDIVVFNSDGTIYASYSPRDDLALFDFDRSTGSISLKEVIEIPFD